MRALLHSFVVIAALGCSASKHPGPSTDANNLGGDGGGSAGTPAFTITGPEIMLSPGQEVLYCYYFHTPNTEDIVVKKWSSTMSPGSHHLIFYLAQSAEMPDGTLTTANCGIGASGSIGSGFDVWTYSAATSPRELDLPSDDGTGKPVGQIIKANSPAYIQMHYLNAGETTLMAQVVVNAYAYPTGTVFTQTEPFISYNANISIPPHATNVVQAQTCAAPTGLNFWEMSTHAHKQAIDEQVSDGSNVLVDSTDWSHPAETLWNQPSFYQFTDNFTYSCTYDNTLPCTDPNDPCNADDTVQSGPSAATNEMCMGVGWYFPGSQPTVCINSLTL
jgi:hypothetical protein